MPRNAAVKRLGVERRGVRGGSAHLRGDVAGRQPRNPLSISLRVYRARLPGSVTTRIPS
jgi:hypothetical protein